MKDKRRGQRPIGNGGQHYTTGSSDDLNKDERFEARFFFSWEEARGGFIFKEAAGERMREEFKHFKWRQAQDTEQARRRTSGAPEPQRTRQPCPHSVLGVSCDASPQVLRSAYRALAKEHHPDVDGSQDAHRKMVRLNRAYEAATRGLQ